ncbi:MAG: hypothetical protein A2600_09535 [Candidatus Lambdaproteobacteria bacterium RIFOXYD1_FULL_56_27]|uniref:Toluene tolerance protein n=1 Tax=Candidatus Lambdaproteobacteria bacterium RIFOXYD2_FULL_56_26 TaxID=1817773 RepID=A0A1F6GV48_9PROT|nr:MAG: hypothetical protein A2557_04805 [Candidatus Lambdaproteobacteria bacterium RIFOXYD2_FULL_56_26]OGH02289.1 MAG: hypothetical protein A2426_03285 [Candidatus Lambdaproteobacteria bacterium RIFOXYC1_FULL_56_13]OGH10059.1 MAG: hypothetical protein A2600_09535 [Candidatus Lambdaproteobacteria bacterium RIFOXYD1_FULL_56_27]
MIMKKTWIGFLTLALVFLLGTFSRPALADDTAAVQKLVQVKITQVIDLLRDKKMAKPERNKRILDVVVPIFDFKTMAQLSLGKKYWTEMTPAQQAEFSELFVKRLQESYLEKLDLYTDEDVAVDEAVLVKSRIHVRSFLVSKTDKKEMIYKFYQVDEQWKVYDVEILGVSIVQTYRSQFDGLLKSGGIEPLLAKLRVAGSFTVPTAEGK